MLTTRRPSSLSLPGSLSPTMTARLRGLVGVTTGENIDTATVAATSGCAWAYRITISLPMECPSTAMRPSLPGRLCANAATLPNSLTSAGLEPSSTFVTSPVMGCGLWPCPRQSNVTAMKPLRASVAAKGCMSCCEPANPWAMTTTGAGAALSGRNTVTGVFPTVVRDMERPAFVLSSCHSPAPMQNSATGTARMQKQFHNSRTGAKRREHRS